MYSPMSMFYVSNKSLNTFFVVVSFNSAGTKSGELTRLVIAVQVAQSVARNRGLIAIRAMTFCERPAAAKPSTQSSHRHQWH
jgi:hypothetical protein